MKTTRRTPLQICAVSFVVLCLAAPSFAAQAQFDSGDPTADEQLVLEMVNRARKDPAAEGTRLKIDINEGLPAGTGTAVVRPPLAMNKILLGTARTHSQDMFTNNYFAHNSPDGSDPFKRIKNAGYADGFEGENIAASTDRSAAELEDQLMIDSGIADRGHRVNLLNIGGTATFREVGVGFFAGSKPDGMNLKNFITQDFGNSTGSKPLLLGVVYSDKNGNGFYDIGEGLAGVTITPDSGDFMAVTGTAGGFAFPVGTSGTIMVTASGGPLTAPITLPVTLTGDNVKLDFIAGAASGVGAAKITSALNVSGTVGTAFSYTATASGAAPITFSASIGLPDGLTLSGATISGTPMKAGTFVVMLTASNSAGKDTQSLTIVIAAAGSGGGSTTSNSLLDTDGDGFPDELEIALGTSPTDPKNTPFGGAPAGTPQALTLAKFQIKLNFAKTGGDSISSSGQIPIPASFSPSGKQVVVDVGGVIRIFTLTDKAAGVSTQGDTLKVKVKSVKGVVAAQTGTFMLKIAKGNFADKLTDEGLINANTSATVNVPVIVLFNNALFKVIPSVPYKAKQSKSGMTK